MKKLLAYTFAVYAFSAGVMVHAAQPYLGLEYNYYDNKADNFDVLGIVAGIQLNSFFGIEAHYGIDLSESESREVYIPRYGRYREDTSISNYGFALTGQYPLGNNLYLKSLVGVDWITLSIDGSDGYNYSETDGGYFTGKLGIGYSFTPNVLSEVTYNRLDDLNGIGLNLKYVF